MNNNSLYNMSKYDKILTINEEGNKWMIESIELRSIGELIDFPFMESVKDSNFPKRMSYTFRGQSSENFDLKSSLVRNSGDEIKYAEKRLLSNFRKYGELLDPKICDSIWYAMVIAQHHGVPTRCLDFSISPLVALHFALTNNIKEKMQLYGQ